MSTGFEVETGAGSVRFAFPSTAEEYREELSREIQSTRRTLSYGAGIYAAEGDGRTFVNPFALRRRDWFRRLDESIRKIAAAYPSAQDAARSMNRFRELYR